MPSPDSVRLVVYAVAALCSAVVAAVVLAADARRNWNQWLALFLLLVTGNFVSQALIAHTYHATLTGGISTETFAARRELFGSMGTVFLALDPFALAYFVSIFPRRAALAQSPLATALLGSVALALVAVEATTRELSAPTSREIWHPRLALFLYLGGCYVFATWRMIASLAAEPSLIMSTQLWIVSLGTMVATLPRLGFVPEEIYLFHALASAGFQADFALLRLVARVTLMWAALALIAWAALRRAITPSRRAQIRHLVGVLVPIFGAFTLVALAEALPNILGDPTLSQTFLHVAFPLVYSMRWFVFAGAILYGIVRYQVLSVDRRPLVGAAIGVGILTVFIGIAVGTSALGPWIGAGLVTMAALGVGGAGAVIARRRRSAEVAQRRHGRGIEVYRSILAAALAEGPLAPAWEEELARSRRRLDVSEEEHDTLLAIAQMEESRGRDRPMLLGRYQVVRKLGSGGFATVFLARDARDEDRLVVLKRIQDDVVGAEHGAEAALREIEVARRVSHPNLVAIHDMVNVEGGAMIVLEYVAGGSLRDLLDRSGALAPRESARILREALAGLAALHEAGIVHGDVKPANLLMGPEGHVKLGDFGTARAAGPDRTLVRGAVGPAAATPQYMAPEQAGGVEGTPASDVYSMGAVAFELLTGKPYFLTVGKADATPRPAAWGGAIIPARVDATAIPDEWRNFLGRALSRSPRDRYHSAVEMLGALTLVESSAA